MSLFKRVEKISLFVFIAVILHLLFASPTFAAVEDTTKSAVVNTEEVSPKILSFTSDVTEGTVNSTKFKLTVTTNTSSIHYIDFYEGATYLDSATSEIFGDVFNYSVYINAFSSTGVKLITARPFDVKGKQLGMEAYTEIYVAGTNEILPKVLSITANPDTGIQDTTIFNFTVTANKSTETIYLYDGSQMLTSVGSYIVSGDNRVFSAMLRLKTSGTRTINASPLPNLDVSTSASVTVTVEPVKVLIFNATPLVGTVNYTNFRFDVLTNGGSTVYGVDFYNGTEYLGRSTAVYSQEHMSLIHTLTAPPFSSTGTKTIYAYMLSDPSGNRIGEPASINITINSQLPNEPKVINVIASEQSGYVTYSGFNFSATGNSSTENVAFYEGTTLLGIVHNYTSAGSNRMFDLSSVTGSTFFSTVGDKTIYAYPCDYNGKTLKGSYSSTVVNIHYPKLYSITATPQSGNTNTTAFVFSAVTGPNYFDHISFYEGDKLLSVGELYQVDNSTLTITYKSLPIYFDTPGTKTISAYLFNPTKLEELSVSTNINIYPDGWQKIPPVIASVPSGTVSSGTKVTLNCQIAGVDIYYTTDGSVPSKSSSKYTSPIVITESTNITAVAFKSGMVDSDIAEFKYIIPLDIRSIGLLDTPYQNQSFTDTIHISGWYLYSSDGLTDLIKNIEIYIDDTHYGDAIRFNRPDVEAVIKGYGDYSKCGFTKEINTSNITEGYHELSVKVWGKDDSLLDTLKRTVRVTPYRPSAKPFIGEIDSPDENAALSGKITVSGWALYTTDGIHNDLDRIEVLFDGQQTQGETQRYLRLDVAAVIKDYGDYSKVGYKKEIDISNVDDGEYYIYVKGFDKNNNLLGTFAKKINVQKGVRPFLVAVDLPVQDQTCMGIITVSGWALYSLDGITDAIESIHIFLNGQQYDTIRFNREDIEAVIYGYGDYSKCGFFRIIDISNQPDGSHILNVVVFSKDKIVNTSSININIKSR